MNRQYKTVWNESTQSWTAVSELAKGHVKSSTKIKLKKLVALISMTTVLAPSLMPPAMAFTINVSTTITGEIIAIGTQDVGPGGVAISSTINGLGIQNINSGGSASNTTINLNGLQVINGGTATSTTINATGN